MNSNQFRIWLKSFIDFNEGRIPDIRQWDIIKKQIELTYDVSPFPTVNIPSASNKVLNV